MTGGDYVRGRVQENPLASGESIGLYAEARTVGQKLGELAAKENDEAARTIVRELGSAGLLRHVGEPFRLMNVVAVREALAFAHGLLDLGFAMQGLGTYAITLAGNSSQKERYVGAAQRGEAVAAFAATESQAGSDLASLATRATRSGGRFILQGSKVFISNGGLADFYTVLVRTRDEPGPSGISMLVVEKDDPGFEIARRQDVMAYHPMAELRFRDCSVPEDRLVGTEGDGFKLALSVLETFRTSVGGAALGMAERALTEALDHVQTRRQFGKPLAELPTVRARLAEMAVEIEASRLLVYRSALRRDGGAKRIPLESCTAKLHATEGAQRVIDQAVQLLGGRGVEKGSAVERLYREIRALRIYEGASDVLLQIIGANLLR